MTDPGPEELREAKRSLRRELFSRLRVLPESEKKAASERIREAIVARPEFQSAAAVAAFVALPGEPNLDPLIEADPGRRQWILPRVTAEGSIEMRKFSGFHDLITGEFKIREPNPNSCPLFPEGEIDLILLPGVGFDPDSLARLGRGQGHYDRFLKRLRAMESPPPVWGVCFSGQLTSFHPEPHDQPMDAIVTDDQFAA